MADKKFEPDLIQIADGELHILWKDQHFTRIGPVVLRGNCGCAHCVDELTHQRRVGPDNVDPDITVEDFLEIGLYAVQILFSDLHETGIFPFMHLRSLCVCLECQNLDPPDARL